jgi:hypothetical protein
MEIGISCLSIHLGLNKIIPEISKAESEKAGAA